MTEPTRETAYLDRARAALKQGNLGAMHTYYALCLSGDPDQGAVLEEYLQRSRGLHRGPPKLVDLSIDGALNFNRLLPTQAPAKILEAALERLKENPLDLDAVHKLGKAAVAAGWHRLAVAAFTDVLKTSVTLRAPGSKLRRDIKMALGKEHYALKAYAESLALLREFQDDPATPKEITQMLKDAEAAQASQTFLKHDKTFNLATAQSVALATKGQAERDADELAALERTVADAQAEPGKLTPAALRLAEILVRAQQHDRALAMLADVEARAGNPLDVAKRSVEIALRKRQDAIDKRRAEAARNPALRATLAELESERDVQAATAYAALVRRAPTDGELRLRLGEALFARWKRTRGEALLKDAITQFQFEFKNDEQTHRARLLLAECFLAIELPGAAEVVLANFLAQLAHVDATKKESAWFLEAQYLLAAVRERLDDDKGATAAYLAVIGKDIGYKDAFERLRALEAKRQRDRVAEASSF